MKRGNRPSGVEANRSRGGRFRAVFGNSSTDLNSWLSHSVGEMPIETLAGTFSGPDAFLQQQADASPWFPQRHKQT
jgi:hypothetical protein